MKTKFTVKEIEDFVHEHIQEEINMGTLMAKGFSEKSENFEPEFNIYQHGLTEGIINGIVMMGGEIEDLPVYDELV